MRLSDEQSEENFPHNFSSPHYPTFKCGVMRGGKIMRKYFVNRGSFSWNIDIKPGSFSGFRSSRDGTTVIFNDLFHNRKSYAGALIFIFAVKLLEDFKYFGTEFRTKS